MPSTRAPLAHILAATLAGCASKGGPPPAEPAGYAGPEIAIDAPGRGAMLLEGGEETSPVTVSGRACDAVHAVIRLSIDGAPVPVAGAGPCRPFAAAHPSRWGLSIVAGEVENDAGESGAVAQSFLRSPSWFPATSGDPGAWAESAVVVQVGPSFLDDGDRGTPDDLATIAQLALAGLDLDASIGAVRFAQPDADGDGHIDTVRHDCLLFTVTNKRTGFEAWKSGPLTTGGISVDRLRLEEGGISMRVTVASPRVPFTVTGNVDSGCLGDAQKTVSGEAAADALVVEGAAQVGLDAGGRPAAAFGPVAAALLGLRLDIDLGPLLDWTGLGSAIGDAIAAEVEGPVQDSIRAAVQGLLEERLSRALSALAGGVASIRLPAELGGAELVVESAVDALDFTAARGVLASALRVRPAAPRPEHAGAPFGAIRLGGARPDASGFAYAALALGVKDDLLNQFLHAAWLAGAFDRVDLALPLEGALAGARVSLFAHLPPVLMPREGGAPWVDLGWGDVEFDLALPAAKGTAEVKGFFSAILPVERLEAGPGGVAVVLGSRVEAHAQIVDVSWDHRPAARAMIRGLVEGAMANVLPPILAGAVRSFPLPALDLRSLDPALPPLSLSFGDPVLARLGRYQFIAGEVVAR